VADVAARALGEVLRLDATALVAAAKLHAQLAHAQPLADVDLARNGGWRYTGAGTAGGWVEEGGAAAGSGPQRKATTCLADHEVQCCCVHRPGLYRPPGCHTAAPSSSTPRTSAVPDTDCCIQQLLLQGK
jgi:hypothetical protein